MSDDLREVIARGLARRRYDHCGGPDGTSLTGKPNWLLCLPDADRAIDAIRDAGFQIISQADYDGYRNAWALQQIRRGPQWLADMKPPFIVGSQQQPETD